MTEAFLQYLWQHKLLDGNLTTTDGLPLVVESPGEKNLDAGPDFFNARLRIGDVQWAGNVEVHVRASEWNQHGHSADMAYNNVILHVVYIHDCDVTLSGGKKVATVAVADAVPDQVWQNYVRLQEPPDGTIACADRLSEIPDFLIGVNKERMLVERMERKSGQVKSLLKETKGNWEETCYRLTAHYFGSKINDVPFDLLTKVTPLSVAAKFRDNAFRVEALYMGQAGFLDTDFEDDYPRALQREYDYLQMAYKLKPLEKYLWKFFRLRPSSFPTIRISQFAGLISKTRNLFSKLLEADGVEALRSLYEVSASDYWNTHYTFDTPAQECPKSLGKGFVDVLIVNAWAPLLFQYGVEHGEDAFKQKAFDLLRKLPPENNRIVRLWRAAGVEAKHAADTQALLQSYNVYCRPKRCLDCQLAFRILKLK